MKKRCVMCVVIVVMALTSGCAMQKRMDRAKVETITIDMTVLFDFNKYVLRKDAVHILDEVAAKLRRHPKTFIVLEGHTDRKGSAKYNEVLAEKRARSVGAYLSQQGVRYDKMTFISMGKRMLKDTKKTKQADQANRRVEIYNR